MNPVVLSAEHLSISFSQYRSAFHKSQVTAVGDLSLSVRAKELVAVIGASGAGKSLLAHAIFGTLPYNAAVTGSLFFEGQPLTPVRIKALRGRDMVLVPQSVAALDPLMRVENQLRRGRSKKEWGPKIGKVLERYGLPADAGTLYPFALSGGMARRVLIANALLQSPRLIVADEPTPGLDESTAKRVLGHFRELADAGAAVLLITHDLSLALSCADRVVVLYGGTAVEDAAVSDFKDAETVRSPYTRALWHAMPRNGFQPPAHPLRDGVGCPFASICDAADEDCTLGDIPYLPLRGGWVRCLKGDANHGIDG